MAKRTVIEINEELCNGCGLCAAGCPEGALQIIDGKARLVGESLCDGLGACIGECPQNAIDKTEREAEPYSERAVIENIIPKGMNTIRAHLKHLKHHGPGAWASSEQGERPAQDSWHREALAILAEKGITLPEEAAEHRAAGDGATLFKAGSPARPIAPATHHEGCPGSAMRSFKAAGTPTQAKPARPAEPATEASSARSSMRSRLEQWPIQLHLVNPRAPYFKGEHLLIAADCTAFACGAFHPALLAGKKLVIACPKLDSNKEVYVDKIKALIDDSEISEITLAIMEVPCCGGLSALVSQALRETRRKVPVSTVVVGIEGGNLIWQ